MDNTPTQTVQIATPASLHARDSPAFVETPHMDFNVFGYTFTTSAATSQSRHDRRPSTGSSLEFPPCYSESHHDIVPSYTASYEPATLAMYLFRFGFCESSPSLLSQIFDCFLAHQFFLFSVPAFLANGYIHPLLAPTRPSFSTFPRWRTHYLFLAP